MKACKHRTCPVRDNKLKKRPQFVGHGPLVTRTVIIIYCHLHLTFLTFYFHLTCSRCVTVVLKCYYNTSWFSFVFDVAWATLTTTEWFGQTFVTADRRVKRVLLESGEGIDGSSFASCGGLQPFSYYFVVSFALLISVSPCQEFYGSSSINTS